MPLVIRLFMFMFLNNNQNKFKSCFTETETDATFSNVYVVGDFKVDWALMCSNVAREDDYINIIDSYGFTACINEATHVKGNVLDNLLTTELDICASVVRIINSDHSGIIFSIDLSAIPISNHTYSIHRFTDASCSEFACVVNLFYLDACKPIDCSIDEFLVHLTYSMDACFDHHRRQRTFFPFYYSSHSVHLYNEMQPLSAAIILRW